jgi:hypothetical protein
MSAKMKKIKYMARRVGTCFNRVIGLYQEMLILKRFATRYIFLLFVQGWWFSPGTLASSTTKIGRHDIAEILLKVVFSTNIQFIHSVQTELLIKYFCDIEFCSL